MNDSEESLFATGPPPTRGRRLSDPGFPSERLSPDILPGRSRRQSDTGRGFSIFALRRDTLRPRPGTQQSMSDFGRRSSYAETSSATQSFVSFDAPTDTQTNNSMAGFATASDGEGFTGRTAHVPTARSNTVYAPRATGQRLDPRRAATLDPRQAGRSYSTESHDYGYADDSVLAGVLDSDADAGNETMRLPNPHPDASDSEYGYGRRDADPVPDVVLDQGAGDETVRRGTRERTDSSRHRDARDVAAGVATNYAQQPDRDRTVRRPEGAGVPQRQGTQGVPPPQRQGVQAQEAPNYGQRRDVPQQPPGLHPSHADAGDPTQTPRRGPGSQGLFQRPGEIATQPSDTPSRRPQGSPQRLGETPSYGQRRDVRDASVATPSQVQFQSGVATDRQHSQSHPLNSSSAQEAHSESQFDPRRGYKVSAASTNTVVPPGRSPAPDSEPFQDARQRLPSDPRQRIPSTASNRVPPDSQSQFGQQPRPANQAALTATPKPAPDPRQQQQHQASTPTAYPPPGPTGRPAQTHQAAPPASRPPQSQPTPGSGPGVGPRQDDTTYPPRRTGTAPPPLKPTPTPAGRPNQNQHNQPQTPTSHTRPSNASNRPLIPPQSKQQQQMGQQQGQGQGQGQQKQPPARKVPPMSSTRPPLPPHAISGGLDTRYVRMLLAIDDIPSVYNLLASFSTWILLAGFVLFPGTFTSLQQNSQLGQIGVTAADVIKHVSLYVIAWVCTGLGAAGMIYLWVRWRGNWIWCLDRIFLPGLMNSLAGVLSTLSSVLGTQNATLSISSKSTLVVTTVIAGICALLTAFYMLVLVRGLKAEHVRQVGKQHAGKTGKGYAERASAKGGYVNMLLAIDSIPPFYNLLAQFFVWILLAGFVLFPGTFTNLQQNKELGALGITAEDAIKHVSLYVIAWVCTALGAAGMLYLWFRWRGNYIWCANRIFLPGFMNSVAGVLSTISSVLGTQNSTLSIASKTTIIVTTAVAGICGILTAFYMLVLIRGIKKRYEKHG